MDSLVSQLNFAKTPIAELAWLDGEIKLPELEQPKSSMEDGDDLSEENKEEQKAEKLKALAQQEAALKTGHVPSLHRMHASKIPPHKAIFFNEPKLSDLKQVMMKAGFQAEFNKGVLVVDDKIAVRKTVAGIIQLEGCISEEYYKVRSLLYDQYAIV
ncbi:CPSF2 [Bugula neritina]|uniref:Cleavage and polyadenylation specificity factor subunit 2 n=1 Tax=Bugula neritina TaxID=10212 RepID=A0A7J7K212_BUGNE|nr:CPSF2 [Bugula neritina]